MLAVRRVRNDSEWLSGKICNYDRRERLYRCSASIDKAGAEGARKKKTFRFSRSSSCKFMRYYIRDARTCALIRKRKGLLKENDRESEGRVSPSLRQVETM